MGCGVPGVMVYLTCVVIGLFGWSEIIYALRRQLEVPSSIYADRSHLSDSSTIQLLHVAASNKIAVPLLQ